MGNIISIIDYTKRSRLDYSPKIWLRRFTKVVVCSTLFLIFAGGMVTSTGSGLSVPDWPNSYGYFMFAFPLSDMVGGIFYEHGHRMIASLVGFLTLVMAVWIGRTEKRKWVRVLATCALGAVILQGLLGGLTVLFYLPTPISVIHAVLAQSFFVLTIILAYSFSRERRLREMEVQQVGERSLAKTALFVTGLVYMQLILGALMRHTASGLAIPDFPTMGGTVIPGFDEPMLAFINLLRFEADLDPVTLGQVVIHFIHRVGAVLVSLGVFFLVFQAIRYHRLNKKVFHTAMMILGVVLVQFTLGAVTVLSAKQPHLTSFHVVMGAALLGLCVLLMLRVMPVQGRRSFIC